MAVVGVAAIYSEAIIERNRQSERHQLSPGITVGDYIGTQR
jgi:hypothetical protein